MLKHWKNLNAEHSEKFKKLKLYEISQTTKRTAFRKNLDMTPRTKVIIGNNSVLMIVFTYVEMLKKVDIKIASSKPLCNLL